MGCGISRFARNIIPEGDDLSTSASQSKPQPQPEGVSSVNSVKEKERLSTSTPLLAPAPALILEREEIKRIKVNQPESKEDADDDDNNNNKQGHEEADDSIFRYPRSPSFREYCTDPEIRFGIDSGPDNDDDDDEMDSNRTNRKLSKSTMSSPYTQDKAGSNGELAATGEARDEAGKGRAYASTISATGLKIRNVLGNKWGRSGTQGRSLIKILLSSLQLAQTSLFH